MHTRESHTGVYYIDCTIDIVYIFRRMQIKIPKWMGYFRNFFLMKSMRRDYWEYSIRYRSFVCEYWHTISSLKNYETMEPVSKNIGIMCSDFSTRIFFLYFSSAWGYIYYEIWFIGLNLGLYLIFYPSMLHEAEGVWLCLRWCWSRVYIELHTIGWDI